LRPLASARIKRRRSRLRKSAPGPVTGRAKLRPNTRPVRPKPPATGCFHESLARCLDTLPPRTAGLARAAPAPDRGVPPDGPALEPLEGSAQARRVAAVPWLLFRPLRRLRAVHGAQLPGRRGDRLDQRRPRADPRRADRERPPPGLERA